ncbi:hypothetical protein [Streptomyces prunicolor]|jgi:hypothetical protein|uniref:hypothetical protein n=1 Tax=Streptomyces prunicolor TaxID=67348 RepID=UPI000376CBED|nr:hypothetical protein [Streptomyces prunicolor]
MIEQDLGSGLSPDPLEERLRNALRARADSVDLHTLRAPAPPTGRPRLFRLPALHPVRRTAVALLVVAAAVIGVLFVAIHEVRETPVPPANRPSVSPTPNATDAVPDPPESGGVDASRHP